MAIMKDRFNLQLSPEEIEALFLYFSPQHAEALLGDDTERIPAVQLKDIESCNMLIEGKTRSLTSLLFTKQEFHKKLRKYVISKAQFADFVI